MTFSEPLTRIPDHLVCTSVNAASHADAGAIRILCDWWNDNHAGSPLAMACSAHLWVIDRVRPTVIRSCCGHGLTVPVQLFAQAWRSATAQCGDQLLIAFLSHQATHRADRQGFVTTHLVNGQMYDSQGLDWWDDVAEANRELANFPRRFAEVWQALQPPRRSA